MKFIFLSLLTFILATTQLRAEVIFNGELGKMALFKRTFTFSEADLETCEKNWTVESMNSNIGTFYESGCKIEIVTKDKKPTRILNNKYVNKSWSKYILINNENVWSRIIPTTEGLSISFNPRDQFNIDFKFYKNTIKDYLNNTNWALDIYFYALDEQKIQNSKAQTIRLDDAFMVGRKYSFDLNQCALNWKKQKNSYSCELTQFSKSTSAYGFNPASIIQTKKYGNHKADFYISGFEGNFKLSVHSQDFINGLPTDFSYFEADLKAMIETETSKGNKFTSTEMLSKTEMEQTDSEKLKVLGYGILNALTFKLRKEECKATWLTENYPDVNNSYGTCDIKTGTKIDYSVWHLSADEFSQYDVLPNAEEKYIEAAFLTGASTFYVELETYPMTDLSFESAWQTIEKYLSGHDYNFSYYYLSAKP